jgi:hypothetical protein
MDKVQLMGNDHIVQIVQFSDYSLYFLVVQSLCSTIRLSVRFPCLGVNRTGSQQENIMKSRKLVFLLVVLLLLIVVSTVSAHGNDSGKRSNAGWTCFIAGPSDWVHCTAPGKSMNPGNAGNVMVYDCKAPSCVVVDAEAGTFDGVGHPFLGTELLISAEVYNDQPCATDGGGLYHPLGPWMACHHFDTSH